MTAFRANAARRAVRLLFVLQGHTIEGLRLAQIAEAMQAGMSTTLRDLQLLADEGVAERLPNDDLRWRLTPRLVQIATAHERELAQARDRLDEAQQRYSRLPN